MDFRVLIIRNRLKVDISDDLKKWIDFEEKHTPLKISTAEIQTDLDLSHKSFGIRRMQGDQMIDMYGLDSVKPKLRDLNVVPKNVYHAVIFIYDLEDTGWFEEHAPKGHHIGHWCYFKEIHPGTEFIEIATTEGWDDIGDVYRVLTHEIRHAYGNRVKRQGVAYSDPMDRTPVPTDCSTNKPNPEGKCSQLIPYYKEFEVEAPDGNRAIANNALNAYWALVAEHPHSKVFLNMLELMVKLLEQVIVLLLKPKTEEAKEKEEKKKNRIEEWAQAIKQFEGWFVGSRSYRNNNPGNLRWSKYQIGTDSGNFAIFPDYETGWKALIFQLTIAADGRSKVYKPHFSLLEFFEVYAPSSDNNHPRGYAQFVADKLGVSITTQIQELIS